MYDDDDDYKHKYIYKSPLDSGHIQFALTKKQHNELFPKRQVKWGDRYEYYYNDYHILLHCFSNWKVKILGTLLFPVNILVFGVANYKEILNEYKRMYNEKKHGSFVENHVSSGTEKYDEIMKLIQ